MPKLFIDTHVHIYPDYNISLLLDSALSNFKSASNDSTENSFVLALTERFECNFFKNHKQGARHGKWELNYNSDAELICAEHSKEKIYILSGRQNISAEKLEVLTLGSDDFRAEELPAIEIIKGAKETGLVTIIPWSFGKWMGNRGKLLKKLLEDSTLDFALGDPAHRFSLKPTLFNDAKNLKRNFFCGTDPLPLSGEEIRVAGYGSVCEIEPGAIDAKKILSALLSSSKSFGQRMPLLPALMLQARIRD